MAKYITEIETTYDWGDWSYRRVVNPPRKFITYDEWLARALREGFKLRDDDNEGTVTVYHPERNSSKQAQYKEYE